MQGIPVSLLSLVAGIVITVFSLWVGHHHNLLPIQASQQAPLVDNFFNVMFSIAIAFFLVVEGIILLFAIQFRHRPGDDTDGPHIEGSVPLEIFWTAVPSVIVIGLGIYSVAVFRDMGGLESPGHPMMSHNHSSGSAIAATISDGQGMESQIGTATAAPKIHSKIGIGANPQEENNQADLVVNVTGMQFAWLYEYPNLDFGAGELHVPVGADVQLNLSATDVIHSFWVPEFRLKQDAIPGIPTQLRFIATKPGTYPVVCTELCGSYHGAMRSKVVVHTPEDFNNWVEENRLAQNPELKQTVAVNTVMSKSEFLAPYSSDMGISQESLVISH
jgi:cytochrome c oxidase subunit II